MRQRGNLWVNTHRYTLYYPISLLKKKVSPLMSLHQLQQHINTLRPAQIIGWILSAIGLIIGAVNVAQAAPVFGDTLTQSSLRSINTQPVTVEQGMRISAKMGADTDSNSSLIHRTQLQFCTLGYIDHERRIGYTSAHCLTGVDEGTYQLGGVPVTTRDQRLIGTAYPHKDYAAGNHANYTDIAVIVFSDNVTLGENKYSGDTVLKPTDIDRETAQFCTYGATTQKVQCGGWDPDALGAHEDDFFTLGTNTVHGDSGSAVWVADSAGNPLGLYGISRGRGVYPDNRPNAVGVAAHSIDLSRDFEITF